MTEINPIGSNKTLQQSQNPNYGFDKSDLKTSLFTKLDTNKNGVIDDCELGESGFSEERINYLHEFINQIQRNVNKWFKVDKNKDGKANNVEAQMWDEHNANPANKIGDMSDVEYAKINNLVIDNNKSLNNFKAFIQRWITNEQGDDSMQKRAKEIFGTELTDEDIQLLYDVAKVQANRWLFKSDSLYTRINENTMSTAYNTGEEVPCCGGDVCYLDLVSPPIRQEDENGNIIKSGYTKEEMQDRFRRVSGYMTEKQAEEYKQIIEDVTNGTWECTPEQFQQIVDRINGNDEDAGLLTDKTKADVLPERQGWYNYLKENGLLLEQFE